MRSVKPAEAGTPTPAGAAPAGGPAPAILSPVAQDVALARGDCILRDMVAADLDAVMAIEQRAYSFPWSRGNFTDSLAVGHLARLLLRPTPSARRAGRDPDLLGYCVAMPGVDEMHLLNITVVPEWQGHGHARRLMADLLQACRARSAPQLWLEVRESNRRAIRLYEAAGFEWVGHRRGYYPAGHGQREDARVMRLTLTDEEPRHGLD